MSIIEAMVTSALILIIILGLMELMRQSAEATIASDLNREMMSVYSEVEKIIASESICTRTLKGVDVNLDILRSYTQNIKLNVGSPLNLFDDVTSCYQWENTAFRLSLPGEIPVRELATGTDYRRVGVIRVQSARMCTGLGGPNVGRESIVIRIDFCKGPLDGGVCRPMVPGAHVVRKHFFLPAMFVGTEAFSCVAATPRIKICRESGGVWRVNPADPRLDECEMCALQGRGVDNKGTIGDYADPVAFPIANFNDDDCAP